jgi:hypothetical protein
LPGDVTVPAASARSDRGGGAALFAVVWVVLSSVLSVASAAAAPKRIALLPGPRPAAVGEASLRAKISETLKQHKIQVAAPGQVGKAVRKGGVPSAEEGWARLARKLKVDGFLEVTLSKSGPKRQAEIVVRNGADGEVAGQETFSAKGPPKRLAAVLAASFWKRLGEAVDGTGRTPSSRRERPAGEESTGLVARDLPPPEADSSRSENQQTRRKPVVESAPDREAGESAAPADAPGDSSTHEDTETPEAVTSRPGHRADALRMIEVELDGRVMRRLFQYVPVTTAPYYFMNFVPLVAGRVSWYPITYLGVFAQGEFTSAPKDGAYGAATREFMIGAQLRIPLSRGQVGGSAAFFQHAFTIADTPDLNDPPRSTLPTPDTTYTGARVALNGRLRLTDRILIGLEGAYRLVTNPGEGVNQVRSAEYFPNAAVTAGIDGALFVGVGVHRAVELRAGVDYRRYFFGAVQGNTIMASGAQDDYLALSLGVVGVFGGK